MTQPTFDQPTSWGAQPPHAAPGATPGRAWYRKHWVHLVAVGVIGLGIGGAGGSSSASDAEDRATAAERQVGQAHARQTAAEQAEQRAVAAVAAAESKATQAKADAQASVAAAAAKVKQDAAAVAEREKAVGIVEAAVAANTIDGDGTYLVGEDIQPGTYKSAGGESCYWKRSSKDGEIIDNNLSSGPAVMNVRASDYSVSVERCEPFVLQR